MISTTGAHFDRETERCNLNPVIQCWNGIKASSPMMVCYSCNKQPNILFKYLWFNQIPPTQGRIHCSITIQCVPQLEPHKCVTWPQHIHSDGYSHTTPSWNTANLVNFFFTCELKTPSAGRNGAIKQQIRKDWYCCGGNHRPRVCSPSRAQHIVIN